jgi:MFS family permease
MALLAALLGWLFDGFEMGLFSQVGRPAIQDLLGIHGTPTAEQNGQIGFLFGVIIAAFLVGAATGGVLFGWLGDRVGRVRAMTLSILTYALFTGLCGLATAPWQVGVLRFIAALGMGGEWSLGVALVMEVWPNRSRGLLAGLIGAAANVGYLLVGVVGLALASVIGPNGELLTTLGVSDSWREMLIAHQGWRLLMLTGALPALLTFFIRIFVPESHRWQHEKAGGATSSWAARDLSGVLVGALGPALIVYLWAVDFSLPVRIGGSLLGLLMATAGYTYPVLRFLQRDAARQGHELRSERRTLARMLLAAGLSGVALLATWGSAQWAPFWADQLKAATDPTASAKEWTQMWSAAGAIVGTILAALAGDRFGRKITYAAMCVLSFFSIVWLYLFNTTYGPGYLAAAFVVGVCTASFYGWLPLYLPELFRTSVRATGQGFGYNFGRILAAIGALQTGNLITYFTKDVELFGSTFKGCPLACTSMALIYVLGLILIALAPETKGKPLPE